MRATLRGRARSLLSRARRRAGRLRLGRTLGQRGGGGTRNRADQSGCGYGCGGGAHDCAARRREPPRRAAAQRLCGVRESART